MTVSSPLLNLITSWKSQPTLEALVELLSAKENWLKLPQHIRSRCLEQDSRPGHFIYVKGWEPLEDDYSRLLASLGRRSYRGSETTFLEYFSHREEKVPAMLRLDEAQNESRVAHHLQAQARTLLGKTINAPDPIALCKLTPEAKEQLSRTLLPHLDISGKQQCSRILERDEAAVYIYEQTSLPHRLDDYLNPHSWAVLKGSYPQEFDSAEAIKQWLELFLFFLRADTLAFHEGAIGLGSPFDAGNLCLSGGVADLGTCLVGTRALDPSYIRSSMKMAYEGFLLVFGTLLKLNQEDTLRLIVRTIDQLQDDAPILKTELAQEFRKTLCEGLRSL